jgi:signal transduction histidine kinase
MPGGAGLATVVSVTTLARPDAARVGDLRRRLVPPRLDVAIALVFVTLSVAEVLLDDDLRPLPAQLLSVGAMAILAWRRRFPVAVAFVVVVSNLVTNPEGEFSVLLSLVLVSFTVGAELEPPLSYVGLAVVVVPFLAGLASEGLVPSDVAAALVFLVGPWVVGTLLRQRSASAHEAVSRAARLEREQSERAAAAVEAERTRIARELHDIVSHSLSVVTIQTQAVRRRLLPEQDREAADLAAVESTARDALAEMRRLFGVLRTDGESASLAPQPGLAELGRLVGTADTGDVDVRLVVAGDAYELPPGADLAAYRIAQEGLTNALRHSGATEVRVLVRYEPGQLCIEVVDNGHGLRADDPRSGGHGLVGVRERVALYDGTVELTDLPGGGARLAATLPVKET